MEPGRKQFPKLGRLGWSCLGLGTELAHHQMAFQRRRLAWARQRQEKTMSSKRQMTTDRTQERQEWRHWMSKQVRPESCLKQTRKQMTTTMEPHSLGLGPKRKKRAPLATSC